MERRDFLALAGVMAAGAVLAGGVPAAAADKVVKLPEPDRIGGMPLGAALAARHSGRRFTRAAIAPDALGALLWAAWGVNRPEGGRRTIPTALNRQRMEVYVAREDGVWRYEGREHALHPLMEGDIRGEIDGAPLILLYAVPSDDRYGPLHVGSAYQNVALQCASLHLDNCVKAQHVDKINALLASILPSGWKVIISHAIGHPAA